MVTRNTPSLVIVIFSDEVVKMKFLLLCLDGYLFSVVSADKCLLRGDKKMYSLLLLLLLLGM